MKRTPGFFRRSLPVIVQNEATECGLACLAMVAIHLGLNTGLSSLRLKYGLSRKGVNLEGLILIAESLGLECRPLQLDIDLLSSLQTPCILHWNLNHFVVLQAVKAKHVIIHDPAAGRRQLSLKEFSKHFTGIAIEINRPSSSAGLNEHEAGALHAARLLLDTRGLRGTLSRVLLLGLLLELVSISLPFFLQWVIDHVFVSADFDLLLILGLGFAALVILQGFLVFVQGWAIACGGTSINFGWLLRFFSHLLHLPVDFFEKRHVGQILSSFGSITTIQKTLSGSLVQAVVDGLMALGTLVVVFVYSPEVGMLTSLAVALYALLRLYWFRAIEVASAEVLLHTADQQTHFLESVRGIQSVRLFGKEAMRRIGWSNMLSDQFTSELKTKKLELSLQTTKTVLFGLERILTISIAAVMVMNDRLSLGMLFALVAFRDQFTLRVSSFIDRVSEIGMLRLHIERAADILLASPESGSEGPSADVAPVQVSAPRIELINVGYRYSVSENEVLSGINLTIEPGEFLAITGPSGSGKTTLVKIILGLLQPTEGRVLVNGSELTSARVRGYRSVVATVMQEDGLFSGSLLDNISFFDSNVDFERVERCAELAGIKNEIHEMPMGFSTLTTDAGAPEFDTKRRKSLIRMSSETHRATTAGSSERRSRAWGPSVLPAPRPVSGGWWRRR